MKIHRIALEEFRRFRQPVVIDGLDDGINLFVGPNEAGKSTVAAALRAAFLERYRTSSVTDLAPWDMPQARPQVSVAFALGGHEYQLNKQFLARARCELLIDGGAQRLEGEQAEDELARLLGFEFASRGQRRPEHGGIPGLLWIEQGASSELRAPAGHAQTYLREALTRLSGELTTTDGDRLFERVSTERGALIDGRGGRPKGLYKEAEDALAAAQATHAQLQADKAALDADVDRLAQLRGQFARSRTEQPWVGFEARAQQAREQLAALAREREALDGLRREWQQAESSWQLLQTQVRRDQQDADALQAQVAEGEAAQAAEAVAREALAVARRNRDAQQEAARHLRAALEAAQVSVQRRDLDEQIVRQEQEVARLTHALAQATAAATRVQTLQAEALSVALDARQVAKLGQCEKTLAALRLQQQAAATRLRFQLQPGATLQLDTQPLTGDGDRLLTQAVVLEIPGMGTLWVEPGGRDLPTLEAETRAAQEARDALLWQLEVRSHEQAQERLEAAARITRDLDAARKELALHVPEGLPAAQAACDAARTREAALRARRDALPPAAQDDTLHDAATLRVQSQEAEAAMAQAATQLAAAQDAASQAMARHQVLSAQVSARQAELQSDAYRQARDARAAELVQARGLHDDLMRRVQAAEAALQGQQPEQVAQDLKRLERSAVVAREGHQALHENILQLQGRLEQAGAHGMGERLAEATAALERLQRRRDDMALRTRALDVLHNLLQAQRHVATQRLQAPLSRRFNHYLNLLFPQGQLQLDDALNPAELLRGEARDALGGLSFGTQEQLGILARLAYADLLKEAGRPTLLVLDDALVHTDEARREPMKRALFDAASRHQILLFTCHGQAWGDLGVAPRTLPAGG